MPAELAIVIPTYNEASNLPVIVRDLRDHLPTATIVVVDDNSPDGTGEIADGLAHSTPPLLVIHRKMKNGIGPAYIAGFKAALDTGAALIVAMDADGSHSATDLIRMLAAAKDADLVIGSRYVKGGDTVGWPFHRKVLSRFGGLYARAVLGVPISDLTSGFKVYRRETLANLSLEHIRSDGYGFQIETTWLAMQAGASVVEVPITFHDRVAGKSKLSRRIVFEAMTVVWRLRFGRS